MTQIGTIFNVPLWVETEDPKLLALIREVLEKASRPPPPDADLLGALSARREPVRRRWAGYHP